MLEKPDIPDNLIVSHLESEYDLRVAGLAFLPIGADIRTAVYRVTSEDGTGYFLKLRKNFNEVIVLVPLFLKGEGIQEILVPYKTKTKQHRADFGEYKIILYPFIEGKNSFDMDLSDQHKRRLGSTLKAIHAVQLPPELQGVIPKEDFSPQWRESLKSLQLRAEEIIFPDPAAAKLAKFIRSRRTELDRRIERTEELASGLQSKSLELVLCHTDIHRANMLIAGNNAFYIVDWDAPLLAPKERDLMFIGGGIDYIWKSKQDKALFYEGYGKAEIDFAILAYYRYERVIEDLVAYGEQLLLTEEGGADREPAYERFAGNFEPGHTIEIADSTYNLWNQMRNNT